MLLKLEVENVEAICQRRYAITAVHVQTLPTEVSTIEGVDELPTFFGSM